MKKTYIVAVFVVLAVGAYFGVQYFTASRSGGTGNDVIVREAIAFYQQQNPGLTNLTAKVINYGCHFEVEIQQGGQRLARLGWAGPGSYYVIGK